jgi:hypothetical protein
MGHVLANNTLNLCCGGLKEVGEIECLKVASVDDEIANNTLLNFDNF